MKLIRLATDNNAVFDANFDTPIEISKDSKIALLNLTLEKAFQNFVIGTSNRRVNGTYPTGLFLEGNDAFIPRVVIDTQDEADDFLHQLSGALNQTLLELTFDQATPSNKSIYGGSEYVVRKNRNNGMIEIILQLTPLLPPFLPVAVNQSGIPQGERNFFDRTTTLNNANFLQFSNRLNGTRQVGDRFHLTTGIAKSTDRTNCFVLNEGLSLCRGSGTIAFQIEDSTDNGLGGGVTATNNGFGIGVVIGNEIPLTAPGILADADVDYEVYFNRNGSNYNVIAGKGVARADSGIAPAKVRLAGHPNAETHDYLGIFIEKNLVVGFVSKDDGAQNIQFMTPLELTDEQILKAQKEGIQAYFYFNDDDTGVKICNARVSCSPFVDNGLFRNPDSIGTFVGTRDMVVNALPAGLYNSLPFRFNPANDLRCGSGGRYNPNRASGDFSLTIDEGIQAYLGFSPRQRIRNDQTNIPTNGLFRREAERLIAFSFSDFYIVESMNLPLDSYNAHPDERLNENINRSQALKTPLKGDRKNILATIPMNEGQGVVEYEANTPQFIDIKNLNETNIRNLKFRVLDKTFREIQTANTTNITLLIKGANE
tara:strand:+ start:29 stop:1816 length:1788 start_codon:yes stop_codon:yes gene_type:complete